MSPASRTPPVTPDFGVRLPLPDTISWRSAIVLGLLLGIGFWFWLFALAFNFSSSYFFRAATFPLLLMACAAGAIATRSPTSWIWVAASVSAPTVFVSLMFFAALPPASEREAHLYVGALVLASAFAGAAFGRVRHFWKTRE
jgi:hypothetical protein